MATEYMPITDTRISQVPQKELGMLLFCTGLCVSQKEVRKNFLLKQNERIRNQSERMDFERPMPL